MTLTFIGFELSWAEFNGTQPLECRSFLVGELLWWVEVFIFHLPLMHILLKQKLFWWFSPLFLHFLTTSMMVLKFLWFQLNEVNGMELTPSSWVLLCVWCCCCRFCYSSSSSRITSVLILAQRNQFENFKFVTEEDNEGPLRAMADPWYFSLEGYCIFKKPNYKRAINLYILNFEKI